MQHKISFIITSVDRNRQLQQCIVSIEKAHEFKKDIPIEILLILQREKQENDLQIHYPKITRLYYTKRLGLSAARNFAIERSTGDYFVFLDDDASVNDDFIGVLSKKIIRYEKVNAFCGKIMDPVERIPFSRLFCNNNVKRLGRLDYQYFMGSAHVLSKRVLEKIGHYDERFGVGSKLYCGGEETVLFIRLLANNETVLYLPDLTFFHPIIYPSIDYAYNYGHAFGALLINNCLYDKFYFLAHVFIILKRIAKLSTRVFQKDILKGKYKNLDEKYHYGAWLKGTFKGMKDFVTNEL